MLHFPPGYCLVKWCLFISGCPLVRFLWKIVISSSVDIERAFFFKKFKACVLQRHANCVQAQYYPNPVTEYAYFATHVDTGRPILPIAFQHLYTLCETFPVCMICPKWTFLLIAFEASTSFVYKSRTAIFENHACRITVQKVSVCRNNSNISFFTV